MPKIMVANPIPFKNRPPQTYSPYSSSSVDVKTGSSGPVDFATTRPLIHWRVLAIRAMFGQPLAYRAGTGRIKIRQDPLAVAYLVKSLSKLHCDGRDMPMVAPTIAQIATVGEVEAKI
jgi:hypothetical protein